MDQRLIRFSELTEADLRDLALLHRAVMPTLLSDLGLPMLLRYYQIAQADPNVIGLCARTASGEILGWAMGSSHPDKINAQLRSPLAWFVPQMMRVMLAHPLVLWQLIASVFSASGKENLNHGAIELTYIGVRPEQKGKGLGNELLNSFIEASRLKGYRSVVLSVEKENSPAVSLYQKAGFKIIKTFTEGRYQRHRMELNLA
jgi:ribosomal protein S18 acetylase RimI-like enzyme